MNRGGWWATVHEVAKSQTQLSDLHYYYYDKTTPIKKKKKKKIIEENLPKM